jgi:hypothetical protein
VQDTYGHVARGQKIEMPYHWCQALVLSSLASLKGLTLEAVKAEFRTESMRSDGASLVAAEDVLDSCFNATVVGNQLITRTCMSQIP